ncbi:hypothetical protein N0V82_003872 [Gnomoniopsis sp. IMI 355080]|nr:hypothetical protein N0V82_003872 [Gnomoniopsis sp. IMI 355080]
MVHFYGTEYRTHTSCMTEEQKYQGALYKNKKAKTGNTNQQTNAQGNMAHHAYVEDVVDFEGGWEDITSAPPRAPSPPLPNDINVFDFQVNQTPTASTVALPQANGPSEAEASERNAVVRFEEPTMYDDADMMADDEALISYGTGPIPGGIMVYDTPMPKARRPRRSDKEGKKDKKRKRLHVATHDLEMTDAPVLHSGLTGGLRRMMDPQAFPPSPDYSGSGGEVAETPASPLKKSKHSRHHRSSRQEGGIGNNLMSMLSSGSTKLASKAKKRKSTATTSSKKRHSHHSTKRLDGAKEPKLIGYNDNDGEEKRSGSGALVRYDYRADLFFSMVNKGPESERGCSVNKALKRFHRERNASGDAMSKPLEEKELFKTLRMKRNESGEIVLFCV